MHYLGFPNQFFRESLYQYNRSELILIHNRSNSVLQDHNSSIYSKIQAAAAVPLFGVGFFFLLIGALASYPLYLIGYFFSGLSFDNWDLLVDFSFQSPEEQSFLIQRDLSLGDSSWLENLKQLGLYKKETSFTHWTQAIITGVNRHLRHGETLTIDFIAQQLGLGPEGPEALTNTINEQDDQGRTPLMRAAYLGNSQIIQLLTDLGADLNITNVQGKKAIDYAENWETMNEYELGIHLMPTNIYRQFTVKELNYTKFFRLPFTYPDHDPIIQLRRTHQNEVIKALYPVHIQLQTLFLGMNCTKKPTNPLSRFKEHYLFDANVLGIVREYLDPDKKERNIILHTS